MKYIFTGILLLFCSSKAFTQVAFSGTVRDKTTMESVSTVNIVLMSKNSKLVYAYTMTKDDGSYQMTFSGGVDSLSISVTGFNIKTQKLIVANKTQKVDFYVESEALNITEVIVKSKPVVRRSDTLNYYVASYIDSLDRSIGDVLKKMPGIDVTKSGEIKYNGKAINRFYVEGTDMLKGRYGLATNNIAANDISTVQVLENHQPVNVLKNVELSDKPAINLKLKNKAKGTFTSTVQLGGGYKPAMWNGELTAMYFARKFQTFNTYKANNTGNDVYLELRSLYGGMDEAVSLLGILTPGSPHIDNERYLRNNVNAISTNVIRKLNDNYELSVNGTYLNDFQTSKASSITSYYIPGTSALTIIEQSEASNQKDDAEISLELEANTEKIYLVAP